jgi:ABC-2 type transport system permease protein
MSETFGRIHAMFLRYFFLHKRSLPRTFEIVLWPVMELLVWGYVSVYLRSLSPNTLADVTLALINAMIFWDILYRSQQGVSISFVEDMWTQNIMNLLISPLKIWEWIAAAIAYGILKISVIVTILTVIVASLYHLNWISPLGLYLLPLGLNLLLFGWALGIFTAALMIRWGHAAEALIWGIPFLIQPLAAVFYPLSILPEWLQPISRCLSATYVFEGMRSVIHTGRLETAFFYIPLSLNILYLVLASFFFRWMYEKARATGRLGRLGMD